MTKQSDAYVSQHKAKFVKHILEREDPIYLDVMRFYVTLFSMEFTIWESCPFG